MVFGVVYLLLVALVCTCYTVENGWFGWEGVVRKCVWRKRGTL